MSLQGEGYFEVVHNAKQPFRVVSNRADGMQQVVEDIGTAFNINAYGDEAAIKTTLVEGSASVNGTVLKPNQQAILDERVLKVSSIDTEEAIAWRNGYFLFANEDINSVMRKVARWYDLEVIYQGDLSHTRLAGTVSKFSKVSKVLGMLEETGAVKFKIEGRKIYVSH